MGKQGSTEKQKRRKSKSNGRWLSLAFNVSVYSANTQIHSLPSNPFNPFLSHISSKMGISFSSNRRRNNTHYHHHPPPPYYYSTEASSLPPPPLNYFPAPTQPTSYPPSHNPYPTPPPPIHIHSNHSSHPYHASRYPSRFSDRPYYYANQTNEWPVIRPNVGTGQPIEPPPYIEHQNAKKVRNDVNVHKDTLKVEIDEQTPDNYLVSFVFDALFDGR